MCGMRHRRASWLITVALSLAVGLVVALSCRVAFRSRNRRGYVYNVCALALEEQRAQSALEARYLEDAPGSPLPAPARRRRVVHRTSGGLLQRRSRLVPCTQVGDSNGRRRRRLRQQNERRGKRECNTGRQTRTASTAIAGPPTRRRASMAGRRQRQTVRLRRSGSVRVSICARSARTSAGPSNVGPPGVRRRFAGWRRFSDRWGSASGQCPIIFGGRMTTDGGAGGQPGARPPPSGQEPAGAEAVVAGVAPQEGRCRASATRDPLPPRRRRSARDEGGGGDRADRRSARASA